MERIVIGVDPHKLSATIEVVDRHENVLASGRFATDKAGEQAPPNVSGPASPLAGPRGSNQPNLLPRMAVAAAATPPQPLPAVSPRCR
jgi:hypothetical protein